MKGLTILVIVFSLFPVSMVFSEGRGGGGGSFSGGGGGGFSGDGGRGGGSDFGGGSVNSTAGSSRGGGNFSSGYSSRSSNARSSNFGTRQLGSSYWGSRRSYSVGRGQNNLNRSQGYALSNRNFSSNYNNYARLGGNPSRYVASSVVPARLQTMGVKTMPHSVLNTQMPNMAEKSSGLVYPRTGANGSSVHANAVTPRTNSAFVQNHMSTFANNRSFRSQVNGFNRTENQAGRYYWHNGNGFNYCHYRDGYGCNWYGCYDGGFCFWSCYYGDNWWWYDQANACWDYWDNNNWWYQNPYDVNQTDVYDNGNYVSADDSQVSSSPAAPASKDSQGVYDSSDGTRQVKVMGKGQDAFLSDRHNPPAFKPVYLCSGARDVKFSNSQSGEPARIAVVLADGSFSLFDDQGLPVK
jgi:hypothetical protein